MHNAKRNKQKTVVHYWAPEPSLQNREDNKRPASVAAYCNGHCLFVSRYIQLICLVQLLNMALYLIFMMTEGEENLCVREDRRY